MDGKKIQLLICQVQEKKPEDYKKKYCHGMMHDKNYVIAHRIVVTPTEYDQLEEHNTNMVTQIKDECRDEGITGEIIVQRARGGLGRKGKYESSAEWKVKRKAGNATVVRFTLE